MRLLSPSAICSLFACLLLSAPVLRADATRQDWIGDYAMDHDGHPGTLRLVASQVKCVAPCPGLAAQYTDSNGVSYPTTVSALDQSGQHLAFSIAFPGAPQRFDVFIFSFEKSRFAGTTVWQGRTFGVTATRAVSTASKTAPQTASAAKKTIGADGSVTIRRPDGSVVTHKLGQCGGTTVLHDGSVYKNECMMSAVMPIIPPDPPVNSSQGRWLVGQDDSLLNILQSLMDSASYQNYLSNYENPPNPAVYKQVYYRTKAIADFISPQ